MSRNSPDRRIAKTHASLGAALFVLLQRESWNAITIQQICDTANVARATFYTHFETKIALLDFLIAEQLKFQEFSAVHVQGPQNYVWFLAWLIDHLTSNRALFSRIAADPEAQVVLVRFKAALVQKFASTLKRDGIVASEATSTFVLGGTFDALIAWSKHWKVKQLPQLKTEILAMSARVLEAA